MEGCEEAKADWEKGWAWAKYDPDKTNPEELVRAINENTAFEAELHKKTENREKEDADAQLFLVDPIPCCQIQ